MLFRYSRWDGTQHLADLDADDLLAAMSDDLMSDGDLWNALRRMFQRGVQDPKGQRVPGIQDMLERLRKRRQQQLDRYDLGSALEDIKKKLDEVIRTGYQLLNLVSFLTAGEDEVRAWTVRGGAKAPEAAGKIHTDLERGFIRAEVITYNDLMAAGSMANARTKGLLRLEGKDYVVQDGDILNIRFSV